MIFISNRLTRVCMGPALNYNRLKKSEPWTTCHWKLLWIVQLFDQYQNWNNLNIHTTYLTYTKCFLSFFHTQCEEMFIVCTHPHFLLGGEEVDRTSTVRRGLLENKSSFFQGVAIFTEKKNNKNLKYLMTKKAYT